MLTGMSGTVKTTVIRALAARGFKAIDTDDGWCEPLPDGRQQWRADAIAALLATEDAPVLFVAGCEDNQVQFHPQFDHIVLLSVPPDVLAGRLATRTDNPYGGRRSGNWIASWPISRPSSRCCARWPITRSAQRCHQTR